MIVAVLGLTLVDGVLTIELLDTNSEECNPLMGHLLTRGQAAFFVAKYLLTATGLTFFLVYKNYPMFGTRFRVGFMSPIVLALYLALVAYQVSLLRIGRSMPVAGGRSRHRPWCAGIRRQNQALAHGELAAWSQNVSIQLGEFTAPLGVSQSISCDAAQGLMAPDDVNGVSPCLREGRGLRSLSLSLAGLAGARQHLDRKGRRLGLGRTWLGESLRGHGWRDRQQCFELIDSWNDDRRAGGERLRPGDLASIGPPETPGVAV